ncbi:Zinc finger, PMZ-type [Sesbania bispinosa]|nr:Zinc finger, PMZ-type [Sesbania bispinosa]
MDLNSEDSAINLADDRDVSYSDREISDDSGRERDITTQEQMDTGLENIFGEHVEHPNSEDHVEELISKDQVQENMPEAEVRRIIDLSSKDIKGLEFGSEEDAYNLYFSYAKCHGFAMRKDDVIRDVKGNVIMRQYLCSKAGLRDKKHFLRVDRKKDHRPLTRVNCEAKLRVRYDYKTGKFKVVSFIECHNHELTPEKFVPLIPSYRGLSKGDKAQVDALHSHGVRPCQIMGYLLDQKGGYANVGFCKKDLYNYIDEVMRGKIKDGDAMAALSYLQGKADNEPVFSLGFVCSDDGKLTHLFWVDGISRADYQFFGDVVGFDATYKKNKYRYPLVIFSGKNHHSQTIIFACAIIADETIQTYKWVLEMFWKCMFNKHPSAVATDGDGAMREAIRQVFPNASHRLCAWNLNKNACENVKNAKFLDDFKKAMYSNFTAEQFEEFWHEMVSKHSLQNNSWILKTYDKKEMWATAYLRDKFFGRIRTTSEYRYNELLADFKSLYSEPVLTTSLQSVERHAAKLHTLDIFKDVKHEIDRAGSLNVIERLDDGESVMFRMNQYCNPRREHVSLDKEDNKFQCGCRLFESCGIPCRHIFCAMRLEHMESIPPSLICKRWTKDMKTHLLMSGGFDEVEPDIMRVSRFVVLVSSCNSLCDMASKNPDDFNELRKDLWSYVKNIRTGEILIAEKKVSVKVVGDPNVSFEQEVPSQNDNNISASNQVSRGVSSRVKKHNPSSSTQNVTLSAPDIGHNLQPHNQFIGSSYMGHVHIREGMSVVIPFQPSFGGQVPILNGNSNPNVNPIFPMFPLHSNFPSNPNNSELQNSHAPPNVAGFSGWNDLLQQVMRNSGGTGGYPGQN